MVHNNNTFDENVDRHFGIYGVTGLHVSEEDRGLCLHDAGASCLV